MKECVLLSLLCSFVFYSVDSRASDVGISGLDPQKVPLIEVQGIKYPNSLEEGIDPVSDFARVYSDSLGGFDELVPFVLKSPDQDEAGSCLYMANTGMAEWWLARLDPEISREPEGPIDLSERYIMSLAGIEEENSPVKNWKTDTIFLFNNNDHKSVRNTAYRFTKGWYKRGANYSIHKSEPEAEGASYGTSYNWIAELGKITGGYVDLPTFERDVIFADPESNQWNVGIAPKDIVSQVKKALLKKKAPVQIVYNHFGYWHAVYIIGFNDDVESDDCSFVERARTFYPQKVASYKEQLEETTDPAERKRLLGRIAKYTKTSKDLEAAYTKHGGCKNKGVFYVRDSIYTESSGPLYDYDKTRTGEESHYSKSIILHEYEWLLYLSNHVTQVYVQE